jgi:hypothetical protein
VLLLQMPPQMLLLPQMPPQMLLRLMRLPRRVTVKL